MVQSRESRLEQTAWDCAIGTPEEDHYWEFHGGDSSVGEADAWICRFCGKVDESYREPPSYDEGAREFACGTSMTTADSRDDKHRQAP